METVASGIGRLGRGRPGCCACCGTWAAAESAAAAPTEDQGYGATRGHDRRTASALKRA